MQTLASGSGCVEITAGETNTFRMFGLGNGNTSESYTDIDFGLYLRGSSLQIYESGSYRGTVGTYSTGDKLQVCVEAGTSPLVRYRKNGGLLYTSALTPSHPLLVDTALYTSGASLGNATLTGSWAN
jgi:hypothetical protein